jgi:NDP-sugar pyrophosphorylase family protein
MTVKMQAVILAGGLGKRLQALHPDLPKALVPVAGKPFLHWQLHWLWRDGIDRVHLVLGYRASDIQAWTRDNTPHGLTVTTCVEPSPLGTGGAVKFAEPFVASDPFLVLNGDSLLPALHFAELLEAHRTLGGEITLAVTRIEEAGRYGTVEFDAAGKVAAFREKAQRESGFINGGVYVLNCSALNLIPVGRAVSLETETFPSAAARGVLRAFRCEPPLLDMGTEEGLATLNRHLSKHPFPSA